MILHVLDLLGLLKLLFGSDFLLPFLNHIFPLVKVIDIPWYALGFVIDLGSAGKSNHLLSISLLRSVDLFVFL